MKPETETMNGEIESSEARTKRRKGKRGDKRHPRTLPKLRIFPS